MASSRISQLATFDEQGNHAEVDRNHGIFKHIPIFLRIVGNVHIYSTMPMHWFFFISFLIGCVGMINSHPGAQWPSGTEHRDLRDWAVDQVEDFTIFSHQVTTHFFQGI